MTGEISALVLLSENIKPSFISACVKDVLLFLSFDFG